ncbi:hypothetical protein [Bradyrhizobium nanningense]|uniref:hypothetical protein n=1 Tax=Bradyrhizobium nanningense TaxID=1325118 RepID=UPI0013E8BD13|nr:hypothetical protein [Bradyrhizobium nanningense]
MTAAFVERVTPDQIPASNEEPVTTFVKRNQPGYLARVAVGALGAASFRRTLRQFDENRRNGLRLAHILEVLGVLAAENAYASPCRWCGTMATACCCQAGAPSTPRTGAPSRARR